MNNPIIKFLSGIVFVLFVFQVHAQTVPQGTWTFGGSVGFSSSKQEDAGQAKTVIEFLPDAGYFIIDNLGVGLNGIYSRTDQDNASLTQLAVGPWARYYVYEQAFVQAGFQAGTLTIDGDFGNAKTSFSKIELGLGYSAFLTDDIALEPIIYFNRSKSKDENEDAVNTNTFGLRVGLKIFIGK